MPEVIASTGRAKLRIRTLVAVGGISLALAGCAVQPDPLTPADKARQAEIDLDEIFGKQEPIPLAITLEQAIAFALKYNLDNRLKLMEGAMTARQLDVANLDMLPQLAASGGYVGRSSQAASSSTSIESGQESLEPSVSQDRDRNVADIRTTWNVLDFGLSYVRAKQAADRSLIIEERRRKVVHNIVQDVRSAFWFTYSAEKQLKRLEPLAARVDAAVAASRTIEAQRLQPPIDTLSYRRDLLDLMRQVQALRRDLVVAKTQLAALMGIRPGQAFTLAPDSAMYSEPDVQFSLESLEKMALTFRPELAEENYQSRIGTSDVKAAMLSMLPGLTLDVGLNYDSNSFSTEQVWFDYSARVTGNLFTMFLTGPARVKAAEAARDVAHARRLALSMAVLTQAHVSWIAYRQAVIEFRTASEIHEVDQAILRHVRAAGSTGGSNELDQIRAELNTLLVELRRDLAAAEMNNAVGRVFVTAGADPLPESVASYDLQPLAEAIKTHMAGWFDGSTLPKMPPAAQAAVPASAGSEASSAPVPATQAPATQEPAAEAPRAEAPRADAPATEARVVQEQDETATSIILRSFAKLRALLGS